MLRKITAAVAACALCLGLLAACTSGTPSSASQSSSASGSSAEAAASSSAADGDVIKVVCTVFPAYDWVQQVIGDQAGRYEVTLLLDNGTDLHSYQPTVADIAKISECDLFVYVGGESDEWVDDALSEAVNKDMRVVNLLQTVGSAAVEEELVEGMQGEEEEEEAVEGEEGPEYDEHVWLSLRNAQTLVNAIAGEIELIDPDNSAVYADNAKAYAAKLADLDASYKQAVSQAAKDTVVFGDRFPFRYLVDDYGIKYYAAFVGCSAETEASFETVVFLANKVDELGLASVFCIDGSDQKIAETVIANTKNKDQQVLVMDSLQSSGSKEAAAGKTYLSAMADNLEVLKQGLA